MEEWYENHIYLSVAITSIVNKKREFSNHFYGGTELTTEEGNLSKASIIFHIFIETVPPYVDALIESLYDLVIA